ncbi:hypothetical protein Tco_0558961 [Tanacetum coccineum]
METAAIKNAVSALTEVHEIMRYKAQIHCPTCCLTACANCANHYLKIKMTIKKMEPEVKNALTAGTSGDGTLMGMIKAKDDEIKQMIKDQAKEYYENIQKEKAWEQELKAEKKRVKELQELRDDQERRISWVQEENLRLKQQQNWERDQLIKEFEQKIEEARINERKALEERISQLEEKVKRYEEESLKESSHHWDEVQWFAQFAQAVKQQVGQCNLDLSVVVIPQK